MINLRGLLEIGDFFRPSGHFEPDQGGFGPTLRFRVEDPFWRGPSIFGANLKRRHPEGRGSILLKALGN